LIRNIDKSSGSSAQTDKRKSFNKNTFKILERIRDTINKFTNACAKHSSFLERVKKIENRGVNALLSEILSS